MNLAKNNKPFEGEPATSTQQKTGQICNCVYDTT